MSERGYLLGGEVMPLIPRKVGFNTNGKAIAAGFSSIVDNAPHTEIMMLPSEHVDFIDFNVVGKTKEQIEKEVSMNTNSEGMTWKEWLAAACFGSKYAGMTHANKLVSLTDHLYERLREAWEEGEDPTEYAGKL
jgi:hypothetical protein